MDTLWKTSIWQQFGAAIDMLENNVRACPDELWTASLWTPDPKQPVWSQVWYNVYHCLFWLDLYLSGPEEGFMPPAPFTLIEMDPRGWPDRVYSKDELLTYLAHCRNKCRTTIQEMTDERSHEIIDFGNRAMPFAELQMYNMRHVQEHASQLGMLIGQNTKYGPVGFRKQKATDKEKIFSGLLACDPNGNGRKIQYVGMPLHRRNIDGQEYGLAHCE